jgi:hypothetical protein
MEILRIQSDDQEVDEEDASLRSVADANGFTLTVTPVKQIYTDADTLVDASAPGEKACCSGTNSRGADALVQNYLCSIRRLCPRTTRQVSHNILSSRSRRKQRSRPPSSIRTLRTMLLKRGTKRSSFAIHRQSSLRKRSLQWQRARAGR